MRMRLQVQLHLDSKSFHGLVGKRATSPDGQLTAKAGRAGSGQVGAGPAVHSSAVACPYGPTIALPADLQTDKLSEEVLLELLPSFSHASHRRTGLPTQVYPCFLLACRSLSERYRPAEITHHQDGAAIPDSALRPSVSVSTQIEQLALLGSIQYA